jgi:signal transduction histidine kinase
VVEFVRHDGSVNGINVTLTMDDESSPPPVVHMDPAHLEQVLLNLVKNAHRAMPEGGTMTIGLSNHEAGRVCIAVADTGCGIAPEHLERIFEPFYSTRPGGSGLGLAITRQIVEAAGGCIRVESRIGQGSRFEVLLPRCDDIPGG